MDQWIDFSNRARLVILTTLLVIIQFYLEMFGSNQSQLTSYSDFIHSLDRTIWLLSYRIVYLSNPLLWSCIYDPPMFYDISFDSSSSPNWIFFHSFIRPPATVCIRIPFEDLLMGLQCECAARKLFMFSIEQNREAWESEEGRRKENRKEGECRMNNRIRSSFVLSNSSGYRWNLVWNWEFLLWKWKLGWIIADSKVAKANF
mgnify:CR=1 FL=1